MRLYAQTYYAAIELGVVNQIYFPLFEAIVIHQKKLSNKLEIADFFESFGVSQQKFIGVFKGEFLPTVTD